MRRPKYGIVIPAHNEEKFVTRTLVTLARQHSLRGEDLDPASYHVVVVENGSTDRTAEVVQAYASQSAVRITLLQQTEASMVTSRMLGMRHLLNAAEGAPDYLVSADADTVFPSTWLAAVEHSFAQGADMVSAAGYMEPELWRRCPRFTQRYLDEVGTVFFDPRTVERLGARGRRFLFTEQVFLDFGRPVSDCGFALTSSCYQALGGFRREYYDAEQRSEILAVGWPLMFRADLTAYSVAYLRAPYWLTSPRRLISEPEALFTTSAYQGEVTALRSTPGEQYERLDHTAHLLDFGHLRNYCLKYYIIQRCITCPQLLHRNRHYFGDLWKELHAAVHGWHAAHPAPTAGHVFAFTEELAAKFGPAILDRLRSQPLPA